MKSERLQGVHRLTRRFPVEVDVVKNWQRMAQLEAKENPILQGGPQARSQLRNVGANATSPGQPGMRAAKASSSFRQNISSAQEHPLLLTLSGLQDCASATI
jgi:hypothetical protein